MRHRISLLVVVAFLGASCGGTDAALNPTQPSPSASPLSVGVSTTSPIAVAERVRNPFCPSVAPFNVPLVVVVQPPGGVSVVVTAIRVQFFDTSGTGAPQVTLPGPVPTTQFGSALDNARSGQAFPRDDRDRLRYRTDGDCAHRRRDPRLARTNRNGSGDRRCAVVDRTLQPRPRRDHVGRALHPVSGSGAFPRRRLRPDRACRRRRDARAGAGERE